MQLKLLVGPAGRKSVLELYLPSSAGFLSGSEARSFGVSPVTCGQKLSKYSRSLPPKYFFRPGGSKAGYWTSLQSSAKRSCAVLPAHMTQVSQVSLGGLDCARRAGATPSIPLCRSSLLARPCQRESSNRSNVKTVWRMMTCSRMSNGEATLLLKFIIYRVGLGMKQMSEVNA